MGKNESMSKIEGGRGDGWVGEADQTNADGNSLSIFRILLRALGQIIILVSLTDKYLHHLIHNIILHQISDTNPIFIINACKSIQQSKSYNEFSFKL